jgi:hypothetical protein
MTLQPYRVRSVSWYGCKGYKQRKEQKHLPVTELLCEVGRKSETRPRGRLELLRIEISIIGMLFPYFDFFFFISRVGYLMLIHPTLRVGLQDMKKKFVRCPC